MSDNLSFFSRHLSNNSNSYEEKLLSSLLYSDDVNIHLGDRRLNNIAALTYNMNQCDKIFSLLEKALIPENNPWQTLYKAVLVLHTIILYGSEQSVDKSINLCDSVYKLQTYNSALVKKSLFSFSSGGTDYGAPVRQAAKTVHTILLSDDEIRHARSIAHEGADSLVPLGDIPVENHAPPPPQLNFGQGVETSIGAGFDLSAVPGMYEGRPDRYFDNLNDNRNAHSAHDHQFTREAMNPNSLLDLAFDSPPANSTALPPVEYLPALEEQKELRRLLAEQQEQLERLRLLAQQQQQQVPQAPQVPQIPIQQPYLLNQQPNNLNNLNTIGMSYQPTQPQTQLPLPLNQPPAQTVNYGIPNMYGNIQNPNPNPVAFNQVGYNNQPIPNQLNHQPQYVPQNPNTLPIPPIIPNQMGYPQQNLYGGIPQQQQHQQQNYPQNMGYGINPSYSTYPHPGGSSQNHL